MNNILLSYDEVIMEDGKLLKRFWKDNTMQRLIRVTDCEEYSKTSTHPIFPRGFASSQSSQFQEG